MRKKTYYLQELYVIDGHHYWFDICNTDNLDMAKRLKDLYKVKNKFSLFRVLEVVY